MSLRMRLITASIGLVCRSAAYRFKSRMIGSRLARLRICWLMVGIRSLICVSGVIVVRTKSCDTLCGAATMSASAR